MDTPKHNVPEVEFWYSRTEKKYSYILPKTQRRARTEAFPESTREPINQGKKVAHPEQGPFPDRA